MHEAKIAVLGGGVAGSTIALYLNELGIDVTLFEKKSTLVSGPPFCHLHAGGNLYREISDEQCLSLLEESIEWARYYPGTIDYRPTVIAIPTQDKGDPMDLVDRLEKLRVAYQALIDQDPQNAVLGPSQDYYRFYSHEELLALQQCEDAQSLSWHDQWMLPVVKHIDLAQLKFPLLLVQEYGINIFRQGAISTLALQQRSGVALRTSHEVTHVERTSPEQWRVDYSHQGEAHHAYFDYIINAAGFQSGRIDDMLKLERKRFVEFKAAYVSQWRGPQEMWPELIFAGERGTPRGMAQFTPYPGGYFQLHGMTEDITLFKDGLVESTPNSAQPKLDNKYIQKIDHSWQKEEAIERSESAISYMSRYIPGFKEAIAVPTPLFGAQQIPGEDATLRAADVSFEQDRYARCETVKVSSVLNMARHIHTHLLELGLANPSLKPKKTSDTVMSLKENDIDECAKALCHVRHYPTDLAGRTVSYPHLFSDAVN